MILLIDNYDSFVYNLYQFIAETGEEVRTVRNDRITPEEVLEMRPDAVVISPGPGRPAEAGICEEAIRHFAGKVPILGVCLGHQAICEAFGGEITYAERLMHGKQSVAHICSPAPLFRDVPPAIDVGRYHSLAAKRGTLPDELEILAETDEKEIMAVGHRKYPIYGLQFHPESILTPEGPIMIRNFLQLSA